MADPPEPTPQLIIVTAEHQKWVMQTYRARRCDLVLKRVVDPQPQSLLDLVDRRYDLEKVSTWARASLRAASEHLCLWADLVAPYVVTPGQVSNIRSRPYLLLARAGLEAAAHALWTLEASSSDECVERVEGFILVDKTEYAPNHLRVLSLPDPTLITEMAEAACTALEWGTLRWLTIGGHDLSVFDAALRDVHARMPKKGDAG